MDAKLSSPEATPEAQSSPVSSGSSFSTASSPVSNPPEENNDSGESGTKAGGDGAVTENDEEGFVSGEEDFEPAFVAKGNPSEGEGGGGGGGFVASSSEFSKSSEQRPIAKVSIDDDDDDDDEDEPVVGSEAMVSGVDRELGIGGDDNLGKDEPLVESNGPEGLRNEFGVAVSEVVEEDKVVDGGSEASFAGGDSVVEAVQVEVSNSGVAIVGDAEEGSKDSEVKGVEAPVDGGVKLDNEFNVLESVGSRSVESVVEEEVGGGGSGGLDVPVNGDNGEVESDVETKKNEGEVQTSADDDEDLLGDGGKPPAANGVTEVVEREPEEDVKPIDNGVNGDHAKVELESESTVADVSLAPKSAEPSSTLTREIVLEDEDEDEEQMEIAEEDDSDGEAEDVVFGNAAKQFLEQLERESGGGNSHDDSEKLDGQIVTDSDEEVDTEEEEGGGKELFDSAALAALLKAATGASSDGSGNVTITTSDGARLFSVERPAGLGSSLPKFAARPSHSNIFAPPNPTVGGVSEENLSEEEKKKLEKFQRLRVKYLRLVNRLGVSLEESISRQVLYRLALVSGRVSSREYSVETAKATALKLEAESKDDLDFSLNILVLGKTGVGKSATINSIFGDEKTPIYAFGPATTGVKEIVGVVDGVKVRVFDTPGLKSAAVEQSYNRRVLSAVKSATKKCPPDIVLYVDRLDTRSRDLNDIPLMKSITSALGSSIWRSGIVTLTHAASSPPDGPAGTPLNYELFVAQRSQILQQMIGKAVGDLRVMSPSLMNPISLVENHPSCRKNRDGQKVLPNGQAWRSQLLHLCYSMKILAEASSLSKPQEPVDNRKLFGFRVRAPPLPYLLSWLLQSRAHPKLPADQGGENVDSDIELDDLSDSDGEEEDEYDQLPPFKPLQNSQVAMLTGEQRKAYLEEYDYRVKLLQKKQWREELKRMKEMKKGKKGNEQAGGFAGEDDQENAAPAAVPVPLPDMILPPSFDGDNPAYRYRFLEPSSQFLARPVLDTHGWDHDCGYDGVNVEQTLGIANRFPGVVTVQITKDKKDFNIHLDSSMATKHGETASTMAGFDIQNVGKQLAYIVRGETKFKSFKRNKTAAGMSVTFLGENVSTGFKVEDQIVLGKRVVLVGSTGIVKCQSDSAYGANMEIKLREVDFPIGQDQSTLGLSLVKWRGDLALGANLQSQFSLGRSYKMTVRAGLNNKQSGQISIRTSSSDQLQIALVAVFPIVKSIYKALWPGSVADSYSVY